MLVVPLNVFSQFGGGGYDIDLPWESCITITERGWHFIPQAGLKSLQELVNILVQITGGGGILSPLLTKKLILITYNL